jgi:ion channel-forming bestrophin family protein
MIVKKTLDWRIIIKRSWKRLSIVGLLALSVVLLHERFDLRYLSVSTLPASILGVAISFLLGFRVNSAYERWWEARRIWGALVNDSRSFARQCITFISAKHFANTERRGINLQQIKKELIYRQIAFVYALKSHLRKKDPFPEIEMFINAEELLSLRSKKHIPNAILEYQAERLQYVRETEMIDDYRHMQIDTKLSSLCDSMGACERIKNTVFPRQYGYYSSLFIAIYSYMIPFVLVKETGYMSIPFSIIIAFIFFALDAIANGIEKPFDNTINDTPMSALCRNIEINLREQLGETTLPSPLEPVNGFLD